MSAQGMAATVLAGELAAAVAADEAPGSDGCDVSAGPFGPKTSEWLRGIAAQLTSPRRVRWEDLAPIAENSPGVLRDVSLLRKRLFDQGPMTLEELLQWQARPRHTAKLGALPVSEGSIDLLDRALTAATEQLQAALAELNKSRAAEAEALSRLQTLDPNHLSSLATQLRSLADAIEGDGE